MQTIKEADIALRALQQEKTHLVACLNAVPLRQITRPNAEYHVLLAQLSDVRARIVAVQLVLAALASGLN